MRPSSRNTGSATPRASRWRWKRSVRWRRSRLLLYRGQAQQFPLVLDLAQVHVAGRALATARLVAYADFLARQALRLKGPHHRDLAVRARLRVFPGDGLLVRRVVQRLARSVEEHVQVLLVEALGRRILE